MRWLLADIAESGIINAIGRVGGKIGIRILLGIVGEQSEKGNADPDAKKWGDLNLLA